MKHHKELSLQLVLSEHEYLEWPLILKLKSTLLGKITQQEFSRFEKLVSYPDLL